MSFVYKPGERCGQPGEMEDDDAYGSVLGTLEMMVYDTHERLEVPHWNPKEEGRRRQEEEEEYKEVFQATVSEVHEAQFFFSHSTLWANLSTIWAHTYQHFSLSLQFLTPISFLPSAFMPASCTGLPAR
ncbi:unnamed protein product [Sphagnum troendelagicum]|uniref:Uncharacterized protein n=1 Tax=Sphagnum troendelagicum TaxID=128251 RepID=A0ABP0TMP8_9BRYO